MERVTTTSGSRIHRAIHFDYKNDQSEDLQGLSISFYENKVPAYVDAEMERLYENIYTTVARFKIYGASENTNTFVARKGNKIITIFLFRIEHKEVKVLNEQINDPTLVSARRAPNRIPVTEFSYLHAQSTPLETVNI